MTLCSSRTTCKNLEGCPLPFLSREKVTWDWGESKSWDRAPGSVATFQKVSVEQKRINDLGDTEVSTNKQRHCQSILASNEYTIQRFNPIQSNSIQNDDVKA